jgi:hypothetical protein
MEVVVLKLYRRTLVRATIAAHITIFLLKTVCAVLPILEDCDHDGVTAFGGNIQTAMDASPHARRDAPSPILGF